MPAPLGKLPNSSSGLVRWLQNIFFFFKDCDKRCRGEDHAAVPHNRLTDIPFTILLVCYTAVLQGIYHVSKVIFFLCDSAASDIRQMLLGLASKALLYSVGSLFVSESGVIPSSQILHIANKIAIKTNFELINLLFFSVHHYTSYTGFLGTCERITPSSP